MTGQPALTEPVGADSARSASMSRAPSESAPPESVSGEPAPPKPVPPEPRPADALAPDASHADTEPLASGPGVPPPAAAGTRLAGTVPGGAPRRTGAWVGPSARRVLPKGPVGVAAVLVVLAVLGLWAPGGVGWRGVGALIFGTVCAATAWAVLAFGPDPRNRCGLAMAALAGLVLASAAAQTLAGWGLPGADQVSEVLYLVAVGVVAPVSAALYPDGRLPGWITRSCAGSGIVAAALAAALARVDENTTVPLGAVAVVLLLSAGWARFVTAAGQHRRALQWLAWSFSQTTLLVLHVMFVGEAFAVDLPRAFYVITFALAALPPPVCAVIGIVDPDLLDIRWLIRKSSAWTVTLECAFATTAGTYAALELITGHPPGRSGVTVLCVMIAVLFQPALRAIEDLVDDVLFGGRADPVQALAGLGERFDAGGDPASWLPALRAGLALPYVELWSEDERVASAGAPPSPVPSPAPAPAPASEAEAAAAADRFGHAHPPDVMTTTTVPLVVGDERVGALVVGLPPQVHALPPATRSVLRLVAPPLAQALRAAALAEQLRVSRGQLVEALEEERRRLRRDLHDGLGPIMTGVAYSADAARNLVPVDPDRAQTVLADLRADTAAAITEIRRIVYGLRPPALDELGLVAAIRQGCNRLRAADGRALAVAVEAPGELPPLPAAVEVAAYRIVLEAVTNAARHSGSADVWLTVEARTDRLVLAVRDGGRGAAANWRPGVGLQSMRERAEQVGGTLTAGPGPAGGEVHAEIPVLAS
ncbi:MULTISPECIES: sensor histidine kinase [Pseudofrankia]|uniref:sensor histidine kinase n=1 Tax=Pseudofrankia TaxID=2994363 RepID=UPI00048882B5|nr:MULTISPECIES: sensor histidine kinase [Pseudofrankia]